MSAAAFLSSGLEAVLRRVPALAEWWESRSSCIGLDIGSSSVKAVLLHRDGENLALLQQSVAPLDAADSSQRTQAIRTLLSTMHGGKLPVASAVSGAGSVLRSVLFPKMTPQELRTSLLFEAEKHIPFKLDETFLDFCIMGERPGGRMEVFVAAAKRELVSAHLELLSAAGVVPQFLDLEAVALANAWEVSPPQGIGSQTACLAHIGTRNTILNFLTGESLQFTREFPSGTLQPGAPSSFEGWLSQWRSSLDFYENQFGHGVERLFLSGGQATLAGFAPWLQETAGLSVEIWNPCAGVKSSIPPDVLQKDSVSLGVAVGLAVRGLSG